MTIALKKCTKCKAEKLGTTSFFNVHPLGRGGLSPRCKDCLNAERKARYEWDIDTSRAKAREVALRSYYKNHEANKIKKKEKQRLARQDPAVKAAHAADTKARYAACDKAAYAAKVKAYKALHPEMVSASKRNCKAKRKLAVGTHTAADIKAQFTKQNGRCFYCDCILTNYHVDHFVPLAKGGTNWPSNLVCACPLCNLQKGAKLPDEYRKAS